MKRPRVRVIILRTAGTNCDKETAFAFEAAGAEAELVHINRLAAGEKRLSDYHILAIPGGFTYGDDIASGKVLANEMVNKLNKDLINFVKGGKLVIGICNGFQVLVKAGLLPGLSGCGRAVEATLTHNDSARFEDRWVYLKKGAGTGCVWTDGTRDMIYLPVAHGEGKFIPRDKDVLRRLERDRLIVFEYVDAAGRKSPYPWNPNGSVGNIAGISDPSGRVFGLMPHPERHIDPLQHPRWTRESKKKEGDGLSIFKNGVAFIEKNF
jgi:phosphoribosylformylglycinamidine synthase